MKILALEFSSRQRSVALVEAAGKDPVISRTGPWSIDPGANATVAAVETIDQPGNTQPLHMIEAALHKAGWEREEIDGLAVGLGPGSYTGIRTAIALAQGWQLGRGVQTMGLSSMECLAGRAQREGGRGETTFLIDAQRREFYLAVYDLAEAGWKNTSPLRLAAHDAAKERAEQGACLAGPEIKKWFPAGREVYPDASILGQLAAQTWEFVPAAQLEPIYLRAVSFVKAAPPRVWPSEQR